jgi:transcription elongation GreA/GreB family factor
MNSNISIRKQLTDSCYQLLEERKSTVIAALETIKEGLQQETKSSMGDKFETTRAHLQMEENKLHQQINELNLLHQRLDVVSRAPFAASISLGSVVFTSSGNYFLAIPMGKIKIEEQAFIAISPVSPIGQLLMNKQKGEHFQFNQKNIQITDVL